LEKQNPLTMMNKATASPAQISLDWTMNNETLGLGQLPWGQGKVSLGAGELTRMLIDDTD
jgi:hypothetical protein